MKFQNSDISSFREDAGTTFELTEVDENSKWPPFLLSLFVNEISAINKNSKWPPGSHLVFLINMNFT